MTTILNGLLGGLLVGFLAAVLTRFVADEPSVTATLLERTLGDTATSNNWLELAVSTVYGGLAGGLLVALELFVLGILAVPPTTFEAYGVSIAWGVLLFGVVGSLLWRVSSRSVERSHLGELLVYHLVYGLGLGLWIRLTWIT